MNRKKYMSKWHKTNWKKNKKKLTRAHLHWQKQNRGHYNAYMQKWRKLNPEKVKASNHKYEKKRKYSRKEFLKELKNKPCMDCKKSFPSCAMHFDHRDPKTKLTDVSKLLQWGVPLEVVQWESEKCDLVCANCHAVRTWGS